MEGSKVDLLVDVAMSFYPGDGVKFGAESCARLKSVLSGFIQHRITFTECVESTKEITGTSQPVERVREILTVSNAPIPFAQASHRSPAGDALTRRRHRSWTAPEDTRLLAAIYRFGANDWKSVSEFVGNGRTRGQCSQRWLRGLDPKLSRCQWSSPRSCT
jgi:hypothetical protein